MQSCNATSPNHCMVMLEWRLQLGLSCIRTVDFDALVAVLSHTGQ